MNLLPVVMTAVMLANLSCTTVGVTPFHSDLPNRGPDCELEMYLTPEDINSPYDVTCEVSTQVQNLPWDVSSRQEAWLNARAHLCECGAERVLVGDWLGSWFRDKMDIQVIAIKNSEAVKPGLSYDQAMQLFVCRDRGGSWQGGNCENITDDPFSHTKNAKRQKVFGN